MPIYEYQCLQCGARSEAMQKMADPRLTVCEACGGELKRLISSPAVQFKGSGWYVTDYGRRGGGGKGDSKAAGGEAKGEAKASEGKSDSSKSDSSRSDSSPSGGESKADKPAASGGSTGSGGGSKAD